jgi:asparagine synthase (glutamine-hydrolysing)
VALSSALNLKFDGGFNEKYLLKKAFQDRLPAAVIARGKFPYRAPDSAAFVTYQPGYRDWLLADTTLNEIECIDPVFVRALVKKIFSAQPEQISTRENQTFIFLISLIWLHHYFVKREGITLMEDQRVEPILFKVIDQRSNPF